MATKEELALQREELELEEKRATVEAIKLNNEKLRREADTERMAVANKHQQAKSKGASLLSNSPENRNKRIRRTCNHKMGGRGYGALQTGRGNFDQYAVSKVKLATGDVMIRCSRCRTVWVPPAESDYQNKAGKLDVENYQKALEIYNEAFNFPCDLVQGATLQMRYTDKVTGKAVNHEVTKRYVSGQYLYKPDADKK
jgi:hypothetical protein